MLRLTSSRIARPALQQAVARGFAAKASSTPVQQQRDPHDPDPNTPISVMLDRLADAAFMTELFRGVSFTLYAEPLD